MDMASYKRIAHNRVHVLVVAWVLCLQSAHAVFCPMSVFKIKHGDFSLKAGNSVATFTCNSGFTLLGQKQIVCYGSQWSYDPPICIASTCPKIAESGTLRIKELYDGAMMKFSCTVMNRLEGVDTLICDGSNWNARTPSCKAWDPPTECDFEDAELCGWSHHDEDDQEWIWHTGATKTTRTGPSHDHTLGNNGAGHYMYFETSSPTRTGHEAWFSSPLYPIHYSHNYCFTFWYHSFGADAMGILEVFIKPELADLKAVEPVFYVNTSMGNEWQRIFMPISKQTQPFQIVFVATRGSGYRSDYAIDDVTLSRCVDKTTPANGPETPNLTTASPSLPSVPNVSQQPRTARIRTSHMAVSEVPMTTISRTSRVTGSDTPRTTISRTSLVTSPVQTTEVTKTTLPATQQSTDISRQETSSVTLTDHTSQILTGYQQTSDTQGALGTHDRESAGTDSDTAVETYILIGLGVGIIMIVAIVIGCMVYRKKFKFVWTNESSASTENPLYSFLMDGEKDAEFAKSQY